MALIEQVISIVSLKLSAMLTKMSVYCPASNRTLLLSHAILKTFFTTFVQKCSDTCVERHNFTSVGEVLCNFVNSPKNSTLFTSCWEACVS